jgi:copper(I)-binding protein
MTAIGRVRAAAWRLTVLVALALAVGCGGAPDGGEGERLGDSSLWLTSTSSRMMPAMSMGAVYLTIENRGGEADRLLSVMSARGEASLHETLLEDGVSKMRERADGFEIAPGETLVLEPGGRHIMLMALPDVTPAGDGGTDGASAPPGAEDAPAGAATVGDSLALTLRFERAGEHLVLVALPAER